MPKPFGNRRRWNNEKTPRASELLKRSRINRGDETQGAQAAAPVTRAQAGLNRVQRAAELKAWLEEGDALVVKNPGGNNRRTFFSLARERGGAPVRVEIDAPPEKKATATVYFGQDKYVLHHSEPGESNEFPEGLSVHREGSAIPRRVCGAEARRVWELAIRALDEAGRQKAYAYGPGYGSNAYGYRVWRLGQVCREHAQTLGEGALDRPLQREKLDGVQRVIYNHFDVYNDFKFKFKLNASKESEHASLEFEGGDEHGLKKIEVDATQKPFPVARLHVFGGVYEKPLVFVESVKRSLGSEALSIRTTVNGKQRLVAGDEAKTVESVYQQIGRILDHAIYQDLGCTTMGLKKDLGRAVYALAHPD